MPRRTKVTNASLAVFEEEPAVVSDVVFVMNRFGYVKLVDKALFDKNEEQLRSENVRFVPWQDKLTSCCNSQRKVFFII